jgi:hypothetical protein
MDKERSSLITVGSEEYRLILTTKATKEIDTLTVERVYLLGQVFSLDILY